MHVSVRMSLALCVTMLVALVGSTVAQATPITVNLRVEGSTKTLFEGPVSTEAIPNPPGISTKSSVVAHPCDVAHNGSNGGFVPAGASATSALYDAAVASGLTFDAEWFESLMDFSVSQVGEDIANSGKNGEYWGYAVNDTTANVGGCQFQLAPGSEVLWAYNYFNLPHLLDLSGPASVNGGASFTVHVADSQTGSPIAGASIGQDVAGVTTPIPGTATTDANGNATLALAHAGTVMLKATQPESVRSNGLVVCIHNGNDGTCGTTIPGVPKGLPKAEPEIVHSTPADVATIGGVQNGRHYSHRKGPRILRGLVQVPAGGTLREVRISLRRREGKRCMTFNGATEAFVHARCGGARFFSVGSSESFSYLLPAALPKGRYVYDIEAIDNAGHTTKLVAGVSHVVFYVK
jgi:hypothetical protein